MINIMELPPSMIEFLKRNKMIVEIGKESPTVGNIIIEKLKNQTK